MLYSYYLGLDLGGSSDYTALSLVEEPVWIPHVFRESWGVSSAGWCSPSSLSALAVEKALGHAYEYGKPPNPELAVRKLERFELGTRFPAVVERTLEILDLPWARGKRVAFLVDKTGAGTPPIDFFRQAGLSPIAVTIHGGGKVSRERDGYRVPKRDLATAVAVLLQNRRLKVAKALSEAGTLEKELLNFRVKVNPATAHESFEHWREGDHDDLVLATAMACWFRQWWNAGIDRADAASRRAV